MSKKKATPKVLVCEITGLEIPYSGKGRPPKYHPSAMVEVAKRRNASAYQKRMAAKRELEAARSSA